ncbi:MAG: DUF2806 domain-containing protein [Treponema sp.]|nr:DUF2806 domain-containing protein [Treponema sp.]
MESLTNAVGAMAGVSEGFYALVKKIPILGDVIRSGERKEQTENAVHEKFLNEYRILNDPVYQVNFINQFQNEKERKLIMGHIIDVQSDAQKSLNIVSVLSQFCENTKETKSEEVDDKDMDPDWWLLWLERAKMTSNPLKQQILAKVLEFETKTHGSVSARFIRTLGDMSTEDLNFFGKFNRYFSSDGYLFSSVGITFSDSSFFEINLGDKKMLENLGIARFTSGLGEYRCYGRRKIGDRACIPISYPNYVLLVWKDVEKLEITYSMSLTEEGKQLRKYMTEGMDTNVLEILSKEISSSQNCRVSVHQLVGENRFANKEEFAYENGALI